MTDDREPTRLLRAPSGRPTRAPDPAATVASAHSRPSSLPARWAGVAASSAGLAGGVVGLVVGLLAFPPTAVFAIFELGIPSALVGGCVGLLAGTVAFGIRSRADSSTAQRRSDRRRTEPRWPDVVVMSGAAVVLYALWSMDWASSVDSLGRTTTFESGPTNLLADSALASLVLAAMIIITRWRWPRWFLLATTLTAAVTSVIVAFSRIAAANDTFHDSIHAYRGTLKTSYQPGAAVGIGATVVMAGGTLVGLLHSLRAGERPDAPAHAVQSPASDPAP